ncbi:MAG: lipid-A-disaccharide synthase [Desertifilum sp. SIO1I2]|nr:lipid-A-disaccharide synthase [Desertifilum sp. SIO1I2]
MTQADILILSNGPGEVTTWVRPVVKALREQLGDGVRISVVLSPCPNASGKEKAIALSYPEVDRAQGAEGFFKFLLWGKTTQNWDWHDRGVVLFLGGDQFFAIAIAKRLGYRSVIYAEWDARWHLLGDRFGVMKAEVMAKVKPQYASKFTVVGDLMAEAAQFAPSSPQETQELIGILPGSKPAKLAQGVPFGLAVAEYVRSKRPQTCFILPVAPTLDLATLARFANAQTNPVSHYFGGMSAELIESEENAFLQTSSGLQVELRREFPAYGILAQCQLCLTTIGANTAELGALGIPMIVLIPTQQLDAMRAWDGLPGLLANLPLLGSFFAKTINGLVLRQNRRFAWPNIWAGEAIVPELVGNLQPHIVGDLVLDYLDRPQKLAQVRQKLQQVRGAPGAAEKLAQLVGEELKALVDI